MDTSPCWLCVQLLVLQGLLKLVMWRDMPIPKKGTPYAHQVSDGGRPTTTGDWS